MDKKRILIVAPYNSGTIGLCSLNLYNAFKQNTNFDVKCIYVHKFKNGYDGFKNCEYCVSKEAPVYLKWLNLFKQIVWLRKIKKEFNPDITISTLGSCSTINVLSGGHEKKIGVFHSPHYQEKAKGWIVYLHTLFEYKYVYLHLDRLACVSSEVKRSIVTTFLAYRHKDVQVIYNVHDIESILQKSRDDIPAEELDIVTEKSILYVGRLDKNKAPMRTLYAFSQSLSYLPRSSNLIFIGKDVDNLKPKLNDFIEEHNLKERVFFFGFRDNPYKYLARAGCLVSSSYSEGLPGVMIESLLLGTPVVTTNSSEGIWEIMSCHKDYDAKLSRIYKCDDGYITSNISRLDNDVNDVSNLSKALSECLSEHSSVSFNFRKKINGDLIVKQFVAKLFNH